MSKTFGHMVFVNETPVYTLQRYQYPQKKQTRYEIWVEDNGISITTSQLAQLLADTLQKVVEPNLKEHSDSPKDKQ